MSELLISPMFWYFILCIFACFLFSATAVFTRDGVKAKSWAVIDCMFSPAFGVALATILPPVLLALFFIGVSKCIAFCVVKMQGGGVK